MLFSSLTFICIFLPLVCAVYFLVRPSLRNYVLLVASILFYAWGEPTYVAIMLLTILVNYIGALLTSRTRSAVGRRALLALTVILDLGTLFYFKYFNFFIENINAWFRSDVDFIHVIMPIGISFYTFQAISYAVDVYRRDTPVQKDVFKLALFICLFPQLIAGPIVKYNDIAAQIDERESSTEKIVGGVRRFIMGLAKKVLIANMMGSVADKVFSQSTDILPAWVLWMGAITYSFQLFFDFSGYSDMAIGLGKIFGFDIKENFNYPYISKSITEFWRRWHISLSSWFREYLYIPLGGNRKGKMRTYLNLFVVFLCTGFWHGAAWNFIFWGIWHGVFIVIERLTGLNKHETKTWWANGLKHFYTILVFVVGWVMFRAEDMAYAWSFIKGMFGLAGQHETYYEFGYYADVPEILTFVAALLCIVPLFKNFLQMEGKKPIYRIAVNAWLLILLLLSIMSIASSTYNPFIYFRF